jgi:hypothetical protein
VIDAEESKTFDGLRWWTLGELETTDERFAPSNLPALVRQLVEEGPLERLMCRIFVLGTAGLGL